MAETLKTRIIELLSKDLDSLQSISDIAKKLGVAYSHAHAFVKQLVSERVISQQKVGNTLVCRLDRRSPMTRAYLTFLSYSLTEEWRKKDVRAEKLLERAYRIQDDVHCILFHGSKAIIIAPQHIAGVDFSVFKNRRVLNRFEFMRSKEMYKDCIVLHGAEAYWTMRLDNSGFSK